MSGEIDLKEVFISHSSKDKDIADEICAILEKNGASCWIASRDVPPGGSYGKEIMKAIRSCNILLLLVSKNTNVSDHVTNEIEVAFDAKKVIIPFMLEDVGYPEELEYFLRRKQRLNAYTNYEDSLNILLKAIGIHVQSLNEGKPLVVIPAPPPAKTQEEVVVIDAPQASESSTSGKIWLCEMIEKNIAIDYNSNINSLKMIGA